MSTHSKMKIGFDLSPLNDEATFGICNYAINLLQSLAKIDDVDICLLYPWSLRTGQEEISGLGVQEIQFQMRLVGTRWWEQFFLPMLAVKAGCDAIHSMANVAPVLSARPVILTLHDTITYSGGAGSSDSTMTYLRRFGAGGVRNAAAILTVSEFSRREIVDFFHVDDSKIYVVPNGVAWPFFTATKNPKSSENSPVILACGSLAPNKNLQVTLRAFAQILGRLPRAQLMLFSITPNSEGMIEKMASEKGISPSALNFVRAPNDASMSRIFVDADVLLFPSLREGFGLPVAQAFATGLPVVTSSFGAVAEISGDAALLIDPNDASLLAQAVLGILENRDLRDKLSERGRLRANLFTWDRAATQTAEVYRHVC